jgi:hypothetical protein
VKVSHVLGGLCVLLLATPPVTVSLDLSGVPSTDWPALDLVGLERAAVVRLVQEGFGVVPVGSGAQLELSVSGSARELVLSSGATRRTVKVRGSLSEVHLEVVQKLSELARAGAAAVIAPRPAPIEEPPKPAPPVAEPAPPPEPAPDSFARLTLSAGADAVVRPKVDPLIRLEARLAFTATLGLALTAGWSPTRDPAIKTDEVQVSIGPALRWDVGRLFELVASLQGGALIHHWDATAGAEPSGVHADVLVSAPLSFAVRLAGTITLAARLAPGFSSRSRQHLAGTNVMWERSAFRLETGVSLGLAL